MNQTVVGAVLVLFERLHHGSRHPYLGVTLVEIDCDLKHSNKYDEHHQDEAAAPSAATRYLSLAP